MKISNRNGVSEGLDIIWDKQVEMEDGTSLSTDIYLPSKTGNHPTILIRTPYNKSRKAEINHGTRDVEYFAQHGYAVAIQDVRGRGDSEGDWVPFVNEGRDGYTTINWLASQRWCNKNIGMIGGSYRGFVQWMAASENPDHLTTMVSTAAGRCFQGMPFLNGMVKLTSLAWLNLTGGRTVQNPDPINWQEVLWHLPINSMDKQMGRKNTIWKEWLSHCTLDDYWKKLLLNKEDFQEINLPVLHITGWYDSDQPGALHFYNGMKKYSPAREKQFFISGPWDHGGTRIPQANLGGIDFGERSTLDLKLLHRLWFDAKLKGDKAALERLTAFFGDQTTKTFSMGENKWKTRKSWPPDDIEREAWYLHSKAKANTLNGDGKLVSTPPTEDSIDSYTYNPEDPVISEVDFNFLSDDHINPPLDQRFIERRDDVLVYTSNCLEERIEMTGKPQIVLYASTDKVDTDWVILVSDVYPDGRSVKNTQGYLRTRFRNSLEESTLVKPNRIYRYDFEMNFSINHTFRTGHRIRVSITSSYFPKVNRNPNTGVNIGEGKNTQVARQTIYHDQAHPSKILLPIDSRG